VKKIFGPWNADVTDASRRPERGSRIAYSTGSPANGARRHLESCAWLAFEHEQALARRDEKLGHVQLPPEVVRRLCTKLKTAPRGETHRRSAAATAADRGAPSRTAARPCAGTASPTRIR
jgi:hypothetical protein